MATEKALNLIRQHTKEGNFLSFVCLNLNNFCSLSFSGQFDQLIELIIGPGQDVLFKNNNFLDELMQNLDIQENSAAILCLL